MARGRHARIQFQGIRHCSRSTANVAVVSYIISDRKKKKLTTAVPRAVAGRGFFVCFIRDIIRLQQIYGNVVAIQGSGRLRSTLPPHRMMPTRRSPSRLAVESAAARLFNMNMYKSVCDSWQSSSMPTRSRGESLARNPTIDQPSPALTHPHIQHGRAR
ncbi:hypothetical protein T492DRAFT_251554 [Pavlovales sp. CCMP2436]|nr:hypothetical protein T492DRAFT_251554 [Pavlovales sp. CCMP2436]